MGEVINFVPWTAQHTKPLIRLVKARAVTLPNPLEFGAGDECQCNQCRSNFRLTFDSNFRLTE